MSAALIHVDDQPGRRTLHSTSSNRLVELLVKLSRSNVCARGGRSQKCNTEGVPQPLTACSMLDFWDRHPRSHTFDRGRPPSTARYGRRRPFCAVNGHSENATLTLHSCTR